MGQIPQNLRNPRLPELLAGSEKVCGSAEMVLTYSFCNSACKVCWQETEKSEFSCLSVCQSRLGLNLNAGLNCAPSNSYIIAVY